MSVLAHLAAERSISNRITDEDRQNYQTVIDRGRGDHEYEALVVLAAASLGCTLDSLRICEKTEIRGAVKRALNLD